MSSQIQNSQSQLQDQFQAIIVVGHPSSAYEVVWDLLQQAGLVAAKLSKQQGLSAIEIREKLLSRAGYDEAFQQPIQQIKASPIWHALALDLLLSNDGQLAWGWADPRAIYMLDYWAESDPAFRFVLVFDDPVHSFVRANHGKQMDEEGLQQFAKGWFNYHSALLSVYSRHQSRCVMVHARALMGTESNLANTVNRLLPTNLSTENLSAVMNLPDGPSLHIARGILEPLEHLSTLYQELQALANVYLEDNEPDLPWSAWNEYQFYHAQLASTRLQADEYNKEAQQLSEKSKKSEEENGRLHSQLHQVQKEHESLGLKEQQQAAEAQRLREKSKMSEEENELLLLQLHQVQEDLESLFLKKQKYDKEIQRLKEESGNYKKKSEKYLLQFHQLQERLEFCVLQNPKLFEKINWDTLFDSDTSSSKSQGKQTEPSRKVASKNPRGAADRIKRQLTYRLGSVLVSNSKSLGGVLSMPFSLLKQVREFQHEQEMRGNKKLPPINQYVDAAEAEKVRQHLSYRLGQVLLNQVKSPLGWIRLPWLLRKEVIAFRNEKIVRK